jgi:hypothetical protein
MKLTLTLLAFAASVIAAPVAVPEAAPEAAAAPQGTYATYGMPGTPLKSHIHLDVARKARLLFVTPANINQAPMANPHLHHLLQLAVTLATAPIHHPPADMALTVHTRKRHRLALSESF